MVVDGRIVEEGKHEELLAKKGEYHKLHNMQFEDRPGDDQIENVGTGTHEWFCPGPFVDFFL